MTIDDFIHMMNAPGRLSKETLGDMQELVETFPYFHSGHLLLLKNLHNLGHIRYNEQLRKSSLSIPDRKKLYRLIHEVKAVIQEESEVAETAEPTVDAGKSKINIEKEASKVDDADTASAAKTVVAADSSTTGSETKKIPERESNVEVSESGEEPHSREELLKQIQNRLREIGKGETPGKEGRPTRDGDHPSPSENNPGEDLFVLEEKVHDEGTVTEEEASVTDTGPLTDEHLLDLDSGTEDKKTKEKEEKSRKKKTEISVDSSSGTSFSGWLDYFADQDARKVSRSKDHNPGSANLNDHLIDNFLNNQPRITPRHEAPAEQEDISVNSVRESGLFSETLAKIYLRQGYYTKAIYTYEKLRLKFPEKSSYFAIQIEMIRKRLNDQTKK